MDNRNRPNPSKVSKQAQEEYIERCKAHNKRIIGLLENPDFRTFVNGVIYNGLNINQDSFTGNSRTYYNEGREDICKSILREFYKVARGDSRAKSLLRVLNAERVEIELANMKFNKDKNNG